MNQFNVKKEMEVRISAGNKARIAVVEVERTLPSDRSELYNRHFWLVLAQEAAQRIGMSVVNPTEEYVLTDLQAREFERTPMKGSSYANTALIDIPTSFLAKVTDPDPWREKLKAYVRWRRKTNPQDES